MDNVPSGGKYAFQVTTHSGGLPADATGNVTYQVMQGTSSILTGNMTRIGTGRYRAESPVDSRFTIGGIYDVWATATVGSKTVHEAIGTFRVIVSQWGEVTPATLAQVQAMIDAQTAALMAEIQKIPGGGGGAEDAIQD